MRLITIPISHFCEKARWGLDRAGLAYVEEQHLQLLHRLPVRRAGGRKTTPVLVTGDAVYPESQDILLFVDSVAAPERKLYPAGHDARKEVLELENRWDRRYGVETRRIGYDVFFKVGRPFLRANAGNAPRWQRAVISASYPLGKGILKRGLAVTPEKVQRAKDTVAREMDAVAERLSDGRRYLTGDTFTAADLTFAALTAPLLLVPEYGCQLPRPEALPDFARELVEDYRAHPAAQWVMRVYRDDRH